ncbi:MAG TPA: hypothetical protein GYA10_13420 [Alphaproteobacteria bacterium]|nr:hypothetical protein [Alphaproteobacteria bacterium]
MKILLASLAAAGLALSAGAALAQDTSAVNPDQSFAGVDTDHNGEVTWTEFQLAFADITEEQFRQADADGNGSLNEDEFDSLALATGSTTKAPAGDNGSSPGMPKSLTDSATENY